MRSALLRYSLIIAGVVAIVGTTWAGDDAADQAKKPEATPSTLEAAKKDGDVAGAAVQMDQPDDAVVFQRAVNSIVALRTIDRNWDNREAAGVVIDEKRGDILTAYHVIGDDRLALAYLPVRDKGGHIITNRDHYVLRAQEDGCIVLGSDKTRDLALLRWKMPHMGLKALSLGKTAGPGQAVFGIGNGAGMLWRYTPGSVRSVGKENYTDNDGGAVSACIVSSTLAVDPGDSGGGLISRSGELLGVMVSYRKDLNLVSKSIDISEVKDFIREVREKRKEN